MLTLLLGSDDFSKREYLRTLAAESKAQTEIYAEKDQPPSVSLLLSQDMFSGAKIFVLYNQMTVFQEPKQFEQLAASANRIIIVEEKLDKRSSVNKQLLSHPQVEAKTFNLPHGRDLNAWIEQRVKDRGGKAEPEAVEELAVRLGRDEARETKFGGRVVDVKEAYDLWQADSEISKLLALADGRNIAKTDVEALVHQATDTDVLSITNAIADNQRNLAFELLQKFLTEEGDGKEGIIQLNALLSEQFRNVAAVQDFLAAKTKDDKILELTGWKQGRLFIMKKIAGRFAPKKILDLLHKLQALDLELKTSSLPPRVLLDLIISQLF